VSFLDSVRSRAAAARRRVAFPESADERTLAAVRELAAERIVEPVLVLGPSAVNARHVAAELGIEVAEPTVDARRAAIASRLWERRRAKGLTREQAEALSADPLFFADGLVALGEVDACVAGATHTTRQVLHAALCSVGRAPGVTTVSSAFYMVLAPFRGGLAEEVLTFADCAVVPTPTPLQLADIAMAAAADRRRIVGDEPRVALLSYSTRGSGGGECVTHVQEAVRLLRSRAPDFALDGELQVDAALMPAVARHKAPDSEVAGAANVLIFPTLDSGNIGYKLTERLAGARAVGPIVQGLARPCSDLSRGASVDDIINVAAITALQASGAVYANLDGSRRENES
jgi:phosphate acetyltransferase